ncbi:MAG TPA: YqiA/YcfP family alpha/beta fold hydrolase [Candidatus Saccharimonadales bacterium]|nr:YqiA/YcfP family alpha/beta fold hydrolase [Candidatus Saccharimonadales bacterium]
MIKPVEIKCTGYSIAADWYEGANTDRILLVLPGYSSTKARQSELTTAIVERIGISALVIDYSGHGESPFELKDTRPAQHFLEVITSFDLIKTKYPQARVSVTGSSYGGFLATQLTKYREFEKLVLRAPAIYKPDTFYDLWAVRLANVEAYQEKNQPYRHDSEALKKHPLLARASNFKGKTLVVVHENDELIPRETTQAYIDAFNADSFVAPGFMHSVNQSSVTPQQLMGYQNRIADWLK